MLRKVFKGGKYSRVETICGNTVYVLHNIQVHTDVSDTKLGNIFIVYTAHTNYVTHQILSNSCLEQDEIPK